LLKVLDWFGFNSTFCNWMTSILSSATLSISLNGAQQGYFSCLRGISPTKYANSVGQVISSMKSTTYAGGISPTRLQNIINLLGFYIDSLPFTVWGYQFLKEDQKLAIFNQ